MKRRFEVVVRLKEGLLDPQGKTVEDALPRMGWTNVSEVRVGKLVEMTVDAEDEEAARSTAEEVASRLLANPVIEDVRLLSMEEAG
ncbi:MAG TPA: phosphoribosylformylglycinamidine synthase subunit PurS [Actinomycetota bacterium]|nr:phosphoribosylformylglycinamidine synthase subunit PurS [Actinomycetota bacterium]